MNLAPIVLFVHSRLWHTKQTVEALQKNQLAGESELFIYADAAADDSAKPQVLEVRNYIKTIKGFKKITIIEQDKNLGLATSIIDGVTEVVNKYGKVIVLEDDLVTSPYFLKFINEGLEFYEEKSKVWHITGWNYPIITWGLGDVFLWRAMNCWGWATWADRWQHFTKDADKIVSEFSDNDIKRFNLDNTTNDFFGQIIANKENRNNTWAIFWYATIFKKNGLCVNPAQTLVKNIGRDGSGVHKSASPFISLLSQKQNIKFTSKIIENKIALNRIKFFYKLTIIIAKFRAKMKIRTRFKRFFTTITNTK